jgi:peptidoglycan/xylan/chitin deacetylase (PgdA/CDA1 family)
MAKLSELSGSARSKPASWQDPDAEPRASFPAVIKSPLVAIAGIGKGREGTQSMSKPKNGFADELFFRLLRWSGICFLLRKCFWRNRAAILLYHDPKPEVLDAHLEYLKRVARIVPLPKLWASFSSRPLAVITIDDGVAGNLRLKEVFQKHNVRPTIYLVTGTIRHDAGFWWLSVGPEQDIEQLKRVDNQTRKKLLYSLGFEETKKAIPRQAVPSNELHALSEWADLGAHTRFHPILTRCTDQECQEEISGSKHELLPIGIELHDFAYPNGDYSDREAGLVKAAGFNSARTTDPGWNGPQSDRFRLKCIMIDDEASVDKFAVALTGIPRLAKHFFMKALAHARQRTPRRKTVSKSIAFDEPRACRPGVAERQGIFHRR